MRRIGVTGSLALLVGLWLIAPTTRSEPPILRQVGIRVLALRDAPSPEATFDTELPFLSQVEVLERRNDAWLKVRDVASEAMGWVHASALLDVKALLDGEARRLADARQLSRGELDLAGSGLERAVRRTHLAEREELDLGYRRLDAILASPALDLHPSEIAAFRFEGGLARWPEAAP